ncbi:hypothetical protein AXG93_1617s1360 [Marchantia polymorpha subsp. ruderalis]|uniref:SPEF2 C-terminal domain-containing protein n=1 Tax=Marchantia polymorpha subsp. ruderalis TaxID=1480154 RepID=A0A176W802_MARPO|nr:hypothetical protein AXG93_1617s1360 [Marchantia polymorpha subsp. ruderalis]
MIATLIENDQKDDVTLPVHREWILQYRGGDQARKAALTGIASFPVPGWLIALSSPLPKLHKVIMTAMSAAYDVLGTIFGQGPDASEKSKKKGDKREKEDSDKKKKGDKSDKKSEKSAKKDKGKKSEKQTDDADVLQEKPKEIVETPPPPIDEGIPPAAGREHQVLLQRLQRIAKVAINYFLDLQPIVDGAYRRMDEWGKSRLNAEAEVVKEVVDLAKEAVDENIPLWYKVYLDGDQFRIDESQLQLECSVSDLTNLDLWHCKVMETLLTDFRKLCQGGAPDDSPGAAIASLLTPLPYAAKVILYIAIPTLILTPGEEEPPAEGKSKGKGSKKQEKEKKESKKGSQVIDPSSTTPAEPLSNFVRVGAAKAATDQVLQTVHTSFKDDLKESLLPRLPASKKNPRGPFQDWQNISNFMFQELLDDENKASKFIDWRAFLIALVDAHYLHIISNATREDLISTRKAFIEFATTDKPPEAAGFLTLEEFLRIPLWFDSTTPIPEGEFDLGISVKIFVFNVLDDGGKGVPWVKLLLYLCRDSDPYHALQKAFCVISGTISDDTHLTPEEVLLILYPGGVDASWKAEIVPFIMEDIQNYLYYVAREKFIRAEKAEESDFGGSEESGSHDLSVERASTESTRSEQETVDDFLNFSYGEFPELIQAETVNDFLESLATVAPLDETVKEVPREKPFICDIHDIPTRPARELSDPDEFAIPTTYTVDDIVRTEAMKRLRDMLYCNYSSDTLQLFDKTPIEDDPVEETGDGKLENKKNKDEGGEEGESSDEKTKKKKKKDKKEKKDKKKKKEK